MEEHIKAIQGLIEANKKVSDRTPFLNMALGALETALLNSQEHAKQSQKAEKLKG